MTTINMGTCVYTDWERLQPLANAWASSYFGPHATATLERSGADAYINVLGLKEDDFPKYKALYDEHDPDNDFDPETEFSPGDKHSFIPRAVLLNIVVTALGSDVLPAAKSMVAVPNGVFFMEKPRDGFYIE